jgi:hypothetical protein
MTFPPETAERLGKFLLVAINNSQDNESLNALRKLRQVLADGNISAHDLVQNLIAPPGYSEEQALEIYQRGGDDREQDLRTRTPTVFKTQRSSSKWHVMAKFCLDRIDYADPRHQQFIQSIERQTRAPSYVPSERQQPWLEDIYHQLGGSPID